MVGVEFQRDYVEFAIAAFDSNRQVFGLDWPLNKMIPGAQLETYVNEVDKIARVVGRQILCDKIFHLNAFKVYNIDLEDTLNDYVTGRQVERTYPTQSRIERKWSKPNMMESGLIDLYYESARIGNPKNT